MVNFEGLADEGVIARRDLELLTWVEDADEAWDAVQRFYAERDGVGDTTDTDGS